MWCQHILTLKPRPRGFHLITREVIEALPELGRYRVGFEHTLEGPDDMPAHIKSVLIGPSLSLPLHDGTLALGTWQGIYLCEHRDHGGARKVVATLQGEAG